MTPATEILLVKVPLRLHSEANGSHGHWSVRAARVKNQRHTTAWALRPHKAPGLPVIVTVTRIAPRRLDQHDNLPRSAKAVVDQIADWLGIKDNDPRVTWRYAQRSEGAGVYGVELHFESELAA